MGALTENRKRLSLSSAYSPDPDFIIDLQPSKKPRITTMPPVSGIPSPPRKPDVSISKICRLPSPFPLRRQVHAPQKNLKFFGRSATTCQAGAETSGNWKEHSFRLEKAKEEALGLFGKAETRRNSYNERLMDASFEGLNLEEYKRIVEGYSAASDKASQQRTAASGLTAFTSNADGAGEIVDLQSAYHEEEVKMPQYRQLYEFSRRQDSKLKTLDLKLRLELRKMSALKIMRLGKDKKEDIAGEPFVPLTDEEEDCVSRALGGSNRRECLVSHHSSNIEITRETLQCLRQGAWLNDEVINLYLELLKERERRNPKNFLKCHFFNTFFYKKLIGGRSGYDFKAVRRWTTQKKLGYSLIECQKIFVPIHKGVHWCLAVINVKDEKFQYLDSLKGRDTQVLKVLARYFLDEVKDKSDKDVKVNSWEKESVDDLPEQMNGWDCGVFMIKYVDFYSRGLELCFNQEHMPYFRKRTAMEILRLKAE